MQKDKRKAENQGSEAPDTDSLPELPEGWAWVTWEQIGFSQNGRSFPSREYQPNGFKLLRPGNLAPNGKIDWNPENTRYLPAQWARDYPAYVVGPRELVMNLTAQSLKDEFLGRVCLTGSSEECLLNQRIARLTPIEVLPEYLLWLFKSQMFRRFVDGLNSGSLIQHMFTSQLVSFALPLPPIREQHRIVAEIETQFTRLDTVVTAFKRVQANLKRYRASVLQAACTGRLVPAEAELARAEGRAYELANELLQRLLQERRALWESEQLANMKVEGKVPKGDSWKSKYREPAKPDTSELPDLPEGWVWTSVEQLVSLEPRSLQSGPFGSNLLHSEFQDTGVLAIGIDNVLEGRFSMGSQHRVSLEKYAQLEKYAARPLDVLVTVMATVGRCCVVPVNLEPAIITKHVYRISANKDLVAPPYLMIALWGGTEVRGQIFGKVQGQTRPGINGEILRRIAIPIPPLDEQHRIVAEVERRLSVIDELEAVIATNLKRADRLRQAILKRAFEGKLVPQDPTDEPASILLERIRMERERPTEKPKATPQQTKAPQSIVQPKATAPVQGELALGFRG